MVHARVYGIHNGLDELEVVGKYLMRIALEASGFLQAFDALEDLQVEGDVFRERPGRFELLSGHLGLPEAQGRATEDEERGEGLRQQGLDLAGPIGGEEIPLAELEQFAFEFTFKLKP